MIKTLYEQLITDPNTQKVIVETDRTGVTIETIYRQDCKITIRHRINDFISCWIVKR